VAFRQDSALGLSREFFNNQKSKYQTIKIKKQGSRKIENFVGRGRATERSECRLSGGAAERSLRGRRR
jgi:hypothetical protein